MSQDSIQSTNIYIPYLHVKENLILTVSVIALTDTKIVKNTFDKFVNEVSCNGISPSVIVFWKCQNLSSMPPWFKRAAYCGGCVKRAQQRRYLLIYVYHKYSLPRHDIIVILFCVRYAVYVLFHLSPFWFKFSFFLFCEFRGTVLAASLMAAIAFFVVISPTKIFRLQMKKLPKIWHARSAYVRRRILIGWRYLLFPYAKKIRIWNATGSYLAG